MIQKSDGRLSIFKENEEIAYLIYDEYDDHLDITATFTEPEERGQGLAKELVLEAVSMARAENKKVKGTCPYVPTVIRHKEFDDVRM